MAVTFLPWATSAGAQPQTPAKPPLLQPAQALTQGSLFLGKTDPANTVLYKGEPVMLTPQGHFVIGFGRDAVLEQSYSIRTVAGESTSYSLTLSPREYRIQKIEGVEQKYVTPPKERLDRIRDDNRQIGEARSVRTEQAHFLEGFLQPVDGPITGVYGSQRYFNGKPRRPHYGLDYAAPVGAPVLAPAGGKVVLAHPDMYFSGGTLIVDHGMGVNSSFLHLSKLTVKEGDVVTQGQKIAEVGATGRVTGAHLDWRINWGSVRLDPALVMEAFPALPAESTAAGSKKP
ncbi:M23 family metallopeptidase [Parendozoicomonas haliclonae]|uniref:Murein DD-endopeptidase MepM n=1 Tax=Parendozoicomonas haliclonae TaxID=1960125 RepID=A0A1X7AR28_9GAMM|nr:M23 family metallopeptidase [Parendozoicomonas haliclonae]SMA50603.1 Murein DD-endopeptidase MepM [Parendozoicomonas haliclonae]